MIHIDDIKFDFNAVDEAFARNLYVRWDVFYRDVLRSVIEDFLSRHDEEGLLVRFEQLELNLGDIPQDDFYRQFPIRLKEELEKTFTYNIRQNGVQESRSEQIARRLSNLAFYIEKGFCSTVWEYAEFDLEKELQFLLLNDPGSLAYLFHRIVRYPNYLNRLAWSIPVEQLGKLLLIWLEEESLPQVEKEMCLMELEKENGLLKTYLRRAAGSLPGLSEKLSVLMSDDKGEDFMSWLLNTTLSVYEKRRSLAILLGTRPHIVIGFLHETQDEKAIRSLAEILDKVMIRQIIDAECENHTEIDVPAYWMYLYDWLIENYPFNGVYQFGNKLQFKEYLNVRLLQFIKKRPYSAYLSKTELTVQFLIEVFGREYYLNVLNIIYNQQARNADGSPVYTGYFNMELYYMFLRLSLIKSPVREEKMMAREDFFDTIQEKDLRLEDVRFFMEWLAKEDVSVSEKRNFMALIAEEYPYFLSLLVRRGGANRELLSLLATYMDMVVVRRLISRECSCFAAEVVMELTKLLHQPDTVEWLSGFITQQSEYYIRITLLDWLNKNGNTRSPQKMVTSFLHLLFITVSGNAHSSDADKGRVEETVSKVSKLLHLGEDTDLIKEWWPKDKDEAEGGQYEPQADDTMEKRLRKLASIWLDEGVNIYMKQRILAGMMEVFRDHGGSLVTLLRKHGLLTGCLEVMDPLLLEQLVGGLVREKYGQCDRLQAFCRWMLELEKCWEGFFSNRVVEFREKIIIWLTEQEMYAPDGKTNPSEAIRMLLSSVFGEGNLYSILQLMHQKWMVEISRDDIVAKPDELHISATVLDMLLPDRNEFIEWLETAKANENHSQLMIERFLDKPMLLVLWLKENTENDGTKRDVLRYGAGHCPNEWLKLLQQCSLEPEVLSVLVRQWGVESMMDFIGCFHLFYAEVLQQLKVLLSRIPASLSAIIPKDGADMQQHFAGALLYWLSDEKTFRTSFVTEGIVRQLVFYLHLSYTGRPMDGQSGTAWKEVGDWLMKELKTGRDEEEGMNMGTMYIDPERMDEQIEKKENLPSLQRWLAVIMEQYPLQWLDYMEHGSEQILENRVAKAMNPVLMERLIGIVGASVTPANTVSFSRMMGWMKQRVGPSGVGILFRSLLAWLRKESWKNMDFEQIEMFFFASMEQLDWLNDTTMDHDLKRRILQQHLIRYPQRVFLMVWESIRNNKLHPEDWAKWFDGKDWVRLVGSYSLYKAELLEQVSEYLLENNLVKETQLSGVLANYLTRRNPVFIMQEKDSETVSRLVQSVQQPPNGKAVSQEDLPVVELLKSIMDELQINDAKKGLVQDVSPDEPESISVGNAGLALLAPWFPRLFGMLGLLDEERKDFKDSESRIRAIYILQRLVTLEEKEYQEKELAFNRILVSLPFTEPLPPKMELTEGEIGIVESMLNGVKANWEKMNNSSVRGLQCNFIIRNGHIVQQEKKWTLTVESRSYDMLLDSVPWAYNVISFPWLKKPIYVSWREKEDY
ncbi:contractile injection system tape measure protein [Bacteroides sp.]|uniref:contractile injection system tape measure protein n=1 Tax=Bacteroides sp. TaxID=29523 RepID=UPI0026152434|nr:contractile injection system tape measure protein [Bacteroides sp.]MDD3038137.1 contractile injection system tape measure protein [Bacteroides sp.]